MRVDVCICLVFFLLLRFSFFSLSLFLSLPLSFSFLEFFLLLGIYYCANAPVCLEQGKDLTRCMRQTFAKIENFVSFFFVFKLHQEKERKKNRLELHL